MLKNLIFEDLAKTTDPILFLSVRTPTHNENRHKFEFEYLRDTSDI